MTAVSAVLGYCCIGILFYVLVLVSGHRAKNSWKVDYVPPEKCIDGIVWYVGRGGEIVAPKIIKDSGGTSGISYIFCEEEKAK